MGWSIQRAEGASRSVPSLAAKLSTGGNHRDGDVLRKFDRLHGQMLQAARVIEADARSYGFAKMRLKKHTNLRLSFGDSRDFLTEFLDREASKYAGHPLLFYLDAHWSADLPLFEEVKKIVSSPSQAIVMIDDFQVPGDHGYGYDNYGVGKALIRQYIAPLVSQFELAEFFPRTPSAVETGGRRGCIVLTQHPSIINALQEVSLLRRWKAE